MRLVDTNVIVRYVLGDARAPKTALAIDFIERQCSAERPGLVTSVVLAELVWVLGSRYRLKKREIVAAIDALVQNANLQLDSEDELLAALDAYREYAVDFADCLIAARANALGISAATFDRRAARLSPFQLLQTGS